MKIFISVGHGGSDFGTVGINGIRESDINLELCEAIGERLKINGIEYMLSRTSDVDNPRAEKLAQIEKYNPALVLDIHFNSRYGVAGGVEAYYQNKIAIGKVLAAKISSAVASCLKLRNRGAKVKLLSDGRDYFGMLRNCPCPAVLLETCFIDNANDMKNFMNNRAETFKRTSEAIVKAICSQYKIKYQDGTASSEEKGRILSTVQTGRAKFKVGDRVLINGDLYASANAEKALGSVKNGNTTVTRYSEGARHPYNTMGDLGWMDEESLTLISSSENGGEAISEVENR